MKLAKWLTPLTTITLAATSVSFSLSSCGNSDKVPKEIEQYISDRTFSIMAVGFDGDQAECGCVGTAWILSDMTKQIYSDYKYHLITNWHVTRGFDTLEEQAGKELTIQYYYADSSKADKNGIINYNDESYIKFGKNRFIYKGREESFIYSDRTYGGVDMYVCDVDFQNPIGKIKEKLDRVNAFSKTNGYVNKFATFSNRDIMDKKKYVAGYPAKQIGNISGTKWEKHALYTKDFKYVGLLGESHYIDDEAYEYADISPQFAAKKNFGLNWMTSGASGSMLITEDYEVCGIYWGGQIDNVDHPTWFKPRFSDIWDFLDPWL